MDYALSRTSAGGGPRTASAASTGHRQAAKSYSSGSSRLSQPSRSLSRPVPGGLVLSEPGPPALPVLLVPLGPLAVQVQPRRSTRRRRPGWHHRGASRRGRARRARARPGPAARPTSPRGSAGPPGPPRRRGPRCRRAPGGRARPCRRGPGTPGVCRRSGQLDGDASGPTLRRRPGSGARSCPPGPSGPGSRRRAAGQARRRAWPGAGTPSAGDRPECRLRFRVPNSSTADPETIAAWPMAASSCRTATARRPHLLTRSGSAAAQAVPVTH